MRLSASLAAVLLASPLLAQSIQPRMGAPVPGLTAAQLDRFNKGRAAANDPLPVVDGLGPIFNDSACASCHAQPTAGGSSDVAVTRFGKAASGGNPFDPLEDLGGSLLQSQAIAGGCEEVVPPEADVTAQRGTPPLFGAGLVEAILDADIVDYQDHPPPGVSGRVHWIQPVEDPTGPLRAGRFGWKDQEATVMSFSAGASLNEMGLTNRFFMSENAPNGDQSRLATCDSVPDPEDGPDSEGFDKIDRFTDFQRFLAPPPRTPRSGMTGEAIFNAAGCASCHVSTPYLTGAAAEVALSGVEITPYSDFLLHDMGTLGDGIVQGDATETEFRTPPLWGLHTRGQIALLHDGRASSGTFEENVDAAITAHDGEAAAARDNYLALPNPQKLLLIQFLDSLGRAEFDYEGDNDVDAFDWFFLQPLFTGPGAFYTADDFASIADIDQDGDFDLVDFGALQRAFGQ
ncbi:MAG: di-heme oxidoredictase family protein [Planctomycetota bacterium]